MYQQGEDDAAGHECEGGMEKCVGMRRGQRQAAVVEGGEAGFACVAAQHPCAGARRGQYGQHGEVPEKYLQQQRNVAKDFDEYRHHFADQPIGRQAQDADQRTDHGCTDDGERRDQQGVEQSHPEYAQVGVALPVGNQALVDGEVGGVGEKGEADVLVASGEVGAGVVPYPRGKGGNGRYEDDLEEQATDFRLVEHGQGLGKRGAI